MNERGKQRMESEERAKRQLRGRQGKKRRR